ncbi:MAG: hypothetical protein AAF961_19710, partial [Planctomycetota bacterium]
MFRFSLRHVLLAMALIAVCAVAISAGTWFWTRALFTTVLAANLCAILAAAFLRGRRRAFWMGFALFGWAYWLIATLPALQIAEHQLFTNEVLAMLKEYTPDENSGTVVLVNTHRIAIFSFERTIHSVAGLLFATIGGLVGSRCYTRRDGSHDHQPP